MSNAPAGIVVKISIIAPGIPRVNVDISNSIRKKKLELVLYECVCRFLGIFYKMKEFFFVKKSFAIKKLLI